MNLKIGSLTTSEILAMRKRKIQWKVIADCAGVHKSTMAEFVKNNNLSDGQWIFDKRIDKRKPVQQKICDRFGFDSVQDYITDRRNRGMLYEEMYKELEGICCYGFLDKLKPRCFINRPVPKQKEIQKRSIAKAREYNKNAEHYWRKTW